MLTFGNVVSEYFIRVFKYILVSKLGFNQKTSLDSLRVKRHYIRIEIK